MATANPDSFISTSVSDTLQQPSTKGHKNDDKDKTPTLSLDSAAKNSQNLLPEDIWPYLRAPTCKTDIKSGKKRASKPLTNTPEKDAIEADAKAKKDKLKEKKRRTEQRKKESDQGRGKGQQKNKKFLKPILEENESDSDPAVLQYQDESDLDESLHLEKSLLI